MTQPDTKAPPFFYMAPLQGLTDALFRQTFHKHFNGFNAALAPFINPQRHGPADERRLVDLLPENNPDLPVIPQLLNTDAADFLILANRLQDLGYRHINWNLGCPAPMVARKKRGAGLLPYPETIIALLDEIVPKLSMELSIKTRLGYTDTSELLSLLPLLDAYPLKEIIVHARLGRQLYQGNVDLEGFARCREATRHDLVYNGDIIDVAVFNKLTQQFPWANRWMIGRGALADPTLIMSLTGNLIPQYERLQRLKSYHDDLYLQYRRRLSGPGHLLGRMKQIWIYLIASFPESRKVFKKIKKANTEAQYLAAVADLFAGTQPDPVRPQPDLC